MAEKSKIPIHDFVSDNRDSIPFKYIPLGALNSYDFSMPHRHNYYEIFFFSKGGGTHMIDFKEYPISDNCVHFVSPGQVHIVKRGLDSYGSIVLFSRDFIHRVPDGPNTLFNFPFLNNSNLPVLSLTKAEYEEFLPILGQMQQDADGRNEIYTEVLRSCVNLVLFKCLLLFDKQNPGHKLRQASVFNTFREMIEKEYRAERQPAYYAGKLNITEKKLNTICKYNTGQSVGDYIKNRILLEAKRLLANTDYNIKEIAYFLGFDDPSYFNRFFKANAGITAGDFRKPGN